MHITLRQLRIFEAVARHSSVSRAAAELHLTQPAVSMQIKQLEEQIGLPLIDQIGKRLFLTEAGHELRGHAQAIAAKMVDLNAAMDQLRSLERGILRLAVVSTANYFLPPLIAAFSEKHPGVRISLTVENREAVLSALADNRTDLAITGQPPSGVDLVAERFMDNPLVVIAAPSHKLASENDVVGGSTWRGDPRCSRAWLWHSRRDGAIFRGTRRRVSRPAASSVRTKRSNRRFRPGWVSASCLPKLLS